MPFSAASAAGIVAMQAAVVNVNGYPMGWTGSISAGVVTPLNIMRFSKRFGGKLPSAVWATAIGDNNRNMHTYAFNPAEMATLGFMFHALDMDAYVSFLKTKKFTLGSHYAIGVQTNAPVNAAQATIFTCMDAAIADPTSSYGQKRFLNEILSLVTVVPVLGDAQEVTPVEWNYEGRPTQAGKMPWGLAYTQATNGFTRGGGILIGSDYPLVQDTFLATGAETTFDLTYEPETPWATYGFAYKDSGGTVTSLATTLSSTKTLTFAALSAGDIVSVVYPALYLTQSI